MKRFGNLYDKIYDWQNLISAYQKARLGKRYKSDVLRFSLNLEEEICNIQNHLIWGTYKPGDYYLFKVYEPKERDIMALPFKDRVVQHALVNVIEPLFNRSFIYDSYACRVGKGSQCGMLRAQDFIRQAGPGCWILKADVKKFFNNIDHSILKRILVKKIKCRKTLWLCAQYIDKHGGKVGIPIGNLTSQLYANIYLDQLDHYVKDMLGIKWYVRYMDDFMIVCKTKEEACNLKKHLATWLWENLRMEFNSKTQVFPERQGVNFLGYRIWHNGIKIRHTTVRRLKGKIKRFKRMRAKRKASVGDIIPTLMSWQGLAKWGNCRTIEKRIFKLLNE